MITEASSGVPSVARLVYLAAFMPDAGEDLVSFLTANSAPEYAAAVRLRADGLVEFDPEIERKLAFQQAPADVADRALARVRPMAMGGGAPTTMAAIGWREIPSTYVVCSEDRSILPQAQRRWAAERATNSFELPFDHCPQLSHPAELAALLAGQVSDLRPVAG